MITYLEKYVDNDDHDRIGQVEEEPDINIFQSSGVREAVGDSNIDGGEDHHAGDVHRHKEVKVAPDIVGCLVDYVHQDCW